MVLLAWLAGFAGLIVVALLLEPVLGIPPVRPWGDRYGQAERWLRSTVSRSSGSSSSTASISERHER